MKYMTVYHIHNFSSPQPQDGTSPSALTTKTPLTAEDDSDALNLDPYTFENPYAT